jgi:hypothetical protein
VRVAYTGHCAPAANPPAWSGCACVSTMAVGAIGLNRCNQSVPQSIMIRLLPCCRSSELCRRCRLELMAIPPRVPRNVSFTRPTRLFRVHLTCGWQSICSKASLTELISKSARTARLETVIRPYGPDATVEFFFAWRPSWQSQGCALARVKCRVREASAQEVSNSGAMRAKGGAI